MCLGEQKSKRAGKFNDEETKEGYKEDNRLADESKDDARRGEERTRRI